jgi:hypothetical protein
MGDVSPIRAEREPEVEKRESFLRYKPQLPGPTVQQVRTTLIATSHQSLRGRGLFDRYTTLLDAGHKDAILTSIAGAWLPIDAACAHYRACDALCVEASLQLAIGMDVGERVHGTFLRMIARTARGAGATPWLALEQSSKLYGRLFAGGGSIAVTRMGPKDARVDLTGNPLCDIGYFRTGVRGVFQAAAQLFCHRVYTLEILKGRPPRGMALRVSWG